MPVTGRTPEQKVNSKVKAPPVDSCLRVDYYSCTTLVLYDGTYYAAAGVFSLYMWGKLRTLWYRTAEGDCPAITFLEEVRRSARREWAQLSAGIQRTADKPGLRKFPLVEDIDDGLCEVRVPGYRIVFHHVADAMLILDGVKKKAAKIPKGDRKRILNYLDDWKSRKLKGEDGCDKELRYPADE